jgi:hypothetical protein
MVDSMTIANTVESTSSYYQQGEINRESIGTTRVPSSHGAVRELPFAVLR